MKRILAVRVEHEFAVKASYVIGWIVRDHGYLVTASDVVTICTSVSRYLPAVDGIKPT